MTITYSAIKEITDPGAMQEFLAAEVVGPTLPGVQVKKVKSREGRRFEAPRILWNVYEAILGLPDGEEVRRLFWTKAYFDDQDCQHYRRRHDALLNQLANNPLDSKGYARFFGDLNLFMFFFPTDPAFPSLPIVFHGTAMAPLLNPYFQHLRPDKEVRSIEAIRVKYLPEISCIGKYEAEVDEAQPLSIYGKVQHSKRGQFTYNVMKALWDLPARQRGELVMAEPLAYLWDYDLLLQSEMAGDEVKGDRHSEIFMAQAEAAGRTLAYIHTSGINVGEPHNMNVEIDRLFNRLDEFKMSSPKVYFMIRDLLRQISAKAERTPVEEIVPSHGDYKYNQFLFDGERFGLIDVEYFVQAEPSFDLGKYCGHLSPSLPKDWSDSAQAEQARRVFLDAYCSVRPEFRSDRFALYEALSLATRALIVMWSHHSNWEYTSQTLVALAYEKLKTRWGE